MLFDATTDATFVGRPDGTYFAVNEAATLLLGYSEAELLSMNGRELVAPEWKTVIERQVTRKLVGADAATVYETTLLHKSGTRIPVEVRSCPLHENGEIVGIHAVVRDLRSRKRAEAELRESEERFRAAFDAAPVGMALASLEGRWLEVNDALCGMLGYTADELVELGFHDLAPSPDLDREVDARRRLLAGGAARVELETRYRRRDGRLMPVDLSLAAIHDHAGAPAYVVVQVVARLPYAPGDERCPLSPRERSVLSLLADGHSAVDVAELLGIGAETVQTHVRRAAAKLGARTRLHAVSLALRNGWIELRPPVADEPLPLASLGE